MTRLIIILIILFSLPAAAQTAPDLSTYTSSKEKLQALGDYCDELINAEDYNGVRKQGHRGILLTPAVDFKNKSLFNFYVAITFDYGTENDSAEYYMDASLLFAQKDNNSRRISEALKQLLLITNTHNRAAKQKQVAETIQQMIDTSKNPKFRSDMLESMGNYFVGKGLYQKGLSIFLDAIKNRREGLISKKKTDSVNLAVSMVNVGELYNTMKQPYKAVEYLKESQAYIKDYKQGVAYIYKDLAEAFLKMDALDSALDQYRKLDKFLTAETGNLKRNTQIGADLDFADYYLKKNQVEAAAVSAAHARKLFQKDSDAEIIAQLNYISGKTYLAQGKNALALEALLIAEPLAKLSTVDTYSALQKSLAEAYAANGQYTKAYTHSMLHASLEDSLLTAKANNNIAEMEARFQNNYKQSAINNLSAEKKLNELEIKNSRRQKVFFIGGLILLFAVAIALFTLFKDRQKTNHSLQKNNEVMQALNTKLDLANNTKAQLFSIISHDLRRPISQVYQFLELQRTNAGIFSDEEKKSYNQQLTDAAATVLDTMEDLLVWSKSQMQHFSLQPEPIAVEELLGNIEKLLTSQLKVRGSVLFISVQPGLSIKSDKNILTILLRNLIQNAIVHSAEKSSITVTASEVESATVIEVADQGNGIPDHVKKFLTADGASNVNSSTQGLGLVISKEMAALVGATLQVDVLPEKGTKISIFIPNNI